MPQEGKPEDPGVAIFISTTDQEKPWGFNDISTKSLQYCALMYKNYVHAFIIKYDIYLQSLT